jgi:hypothetical protein
MLTTHLLVPSLKMYGAMPLFLLKPSLRGEGQIYCQFNIIVCSVKSLKHGDGANFFKGYVLHISYKQNLF